ncbi:hypothetical protein F2Q70_00016046 [Brassica cretica]|uniref:Uncharacterized protein n=1 Tax=Brassica cretica TaxID=69181 RepID=A0A8S9I005_BRACR|nr:hypothetical protein F2Q70_00016046 [Brassica cretica]
MAMKLSLGGDGALSQWLSSNRRIHGARGRNLKAEESKAEQYSVLLFLSSVSASSSLPSIFLSFFFSFLFSFYLSVTFSGMDSNPYRQSTNYVDLLTSQHGVFSFEEDSVQLSSSSQVPIFGIQGAEASS